MIIAGKKADLPLGLLDSSAKIKQTALGKKIDNRPIYPPTRGGRLLR